MKSRLIFIGLLLFPLFAISQQFYSVETHKLNFRSGPSSSYRAILALKEGDLVELVSKEDNGWWKVEYNGLKGYVSSMYLQSTASGRWDINNHGSTLYNRLWLENNNKTLQGTGQLSQSSSSGGYLNSPSNIFDVSKTQETYKIGETEYYVNEYYTTTGLPKVKRSMTARKQFLESKGYSEVPDGYEVDHIKPLSEGGSDESWNMQLITIEEHKRKTALERSRQSSGSESLSIPSINSNSSSYGSPKQSSSSSSSRTIHTGPRGGKYYINSNGNKTYLKKKN